MSEERSELELLIDELVAKAGPTVGQIKKEQDPEKIKRLLELGWKSEGKKSTIEEQLTKITLILADHEKRITECSIRR